MAKLDVSDSWVLVTGASGGIGRAIARDFSERGAKLVLTARRQDLLEELSAELATESKIVVADLEAEAGVDHLLAEISAQGISVDHVVNNAGFGDAGSFHKTSEASQLSQIALNCVALTRLTRHFLPDMVEKGTGGVLQVASVVGFLPTPYMAVYAATKAYVVSFSASLAEELKGTGVCCMALCPGPVATSFQQRAGYEFSSMERSAELSPEQVARSAVQSYLKGRRVCVPGGNNSLLAWLGKHVPHSWSTAITAGILKKAGRAN